MDGLLCSRFHAMMMCQPCPGTPVSHVYELYNKPGHDGRVCGPLRGLGSSPECDFRALAHRVRNVERAHGQLLHLVAGQGLELDVEPADIGNELRVLDHGIEAV